MVAGLWVWLWPLPQDPMAIADKLVDLGVTGVIPQAGQAAPGWCRTWAAKLNARGLKVVAGLGAPSTRGILDGLSVPGVDGVMVDWEGAWDGKQAEADAIATAVLKARPDAVGRVTDCPWWAPLHYLKRSGAKQATHPSAPTKEMGRLVTRRFVQAYGANVGPEDGHSARLLAWARDPSQYASLGSWEIRPAVQMYRRSVADQLGMMLTELPAGAVALWDWSESDVNARLAMEVRAKLAGAGFSGPGAVTAYQASAGLTADGKVGPKTAAALGVTVPAGVVWRHP